MLQRAMPRNTPAIPPATVVAPMMVDSTRLASSTSIDAMTQFDIIAEQWVATIEPPRRATSSLAGSEDGSDEAPLDAGVPAWYGSIANRIGSRPPSSGKCE